MPRRPSNIICPKCGVKGGCLRKKWVKRTVHIPKINTKTSIADAWNYAARVYLRLRELSTLFPPPPSDDYRISDYNDGIYNVGILSQLNLHNNDEIRAFESRHMNTLARNIQQKKTQLTSNVERTTEWKGSPDAEKYDDKRAVNKLKPRPTIHLKLPSDAGRITSLSVSCLYHAIVCLVLRDMSEQYFSSLPEEIEEIQKEFTYAIYTHFSLLAGDLRHTVLPARRFKIFSDVGDYGYRRAVRMNSTVLDQCKNCDEVYEETGQEQEKHILRCSRCGSNVFIKKRRSYTTKHVHNIHSKILKKAEDLIEYWHLLDNFIKKIAHDITNNPELKRDLLRRFQEYELQARKDLLVKRECYCIEHYDPTRKWKKRPCNISENKLAYVEINDERYHLQYKPLIEQALNTTKLYEKVNLLTKSTGLLQKLGWPESLIKDKIEVDVKRAASLNYAAKMKY